MANDIILQCSNCNQTFVFTQDEQQFYASKTLSQPSRCMICRALVREAAKDEFRGQVRVGKFGDKGDNLK